MSGNEQKHKTALTVNTTIQAILKLLVQKTGVNFHQYKPATLERRIMRRMQLLNIKDEAGYLAYLIASEAEQHHLYKEMLVHVTSFFRDESSFDFLCSQVLPAILKEKGPEDTVRIWVCGCATGEEAYTVAMCLHEHLKESRDFTRIKIFASDLSETAIAKARRAIYSTTTLAKLSDARIGHYFEDCKQGKRIKTFIRDMCVFAVHDVLSHPPFANLDLVTCRNVLIYMQPVLQRKVLATFSYALKQGGYLFLGKSETSGLAGKFEPVNKTANIYINKERNSKLFNVIPQATDEKATTAESSERAYTMEKKDFQRATDEVLLARYIPAGVVVNDGFDIVDFRGNTGFYIDPSPGIASLSILKMIRKGLYLDLQEALNKVKAEKIFVSKEGIALEHDGLLRRITLEVQPLTGTREKFYLILFRDVTPEQAEPLTDDGINSTRDLRIHQLEQELMQSREQLRAISEEQEATNEEFQSANDELKALNEELQTSQEELISTNEELSVRNRELAQLNTEINDGRAFTESILNTTTDGLIVLDKDLCVRSANDAFYNTFKVTAAETEGCLIYDLGNKQWNIPNLRRALGGILLQQAELENFVVGHQFENIGFKVMSLNARQLRLENATEPLMLVVITDITERTQLAKELRDTGIKLDYALDTGMIGTWELNPDTGSFETSAQSRLNFGLSADTNFTYERFQSMIVPEDRDDVVAGIRHAMHTGRRYAREFRVIWPDESTHWIAIAGNVLAEQEGASNDMVGVFMDITDRKSAEQQLKYSELHFRTLANSAPVMIAMTSTDGAFNFYNQQWLAFTGRSENDHTGSWKNDMHPDDVKGYNTLYQSSLRDHKRFDVDFRLRHRGRYRWISCAAVPRFGVNNRFDGYTMACTDVHDQKMVQETLERKVEERTEALRNVNDDLLDRNRELEQFASVTSHDLQEPLRKIRIFTSLLSGKNPDKESEQAGYLSKIELAASRMIGLIQDLLNFSSLKERSKEFVPLDLNRTLQDVLADYDLLIHDKAAEITIGNLPVIDGVPLQMNQLFYNLIGNALKFSKPAEPPRIRIIASEVSEEEMRSYRLKPNNEYVRIIVSDNGIGFDEAYSERIFQIFQRLHTKDKYQGNGIGLALCCASCKITKASFWRTPCRMTAPRLN